MIPLLLLVNLAHSQARCSKLVNEFKCPYGGKWVIWEQIWSGFDDFGNYAAENNDQYYFYDEKWAELMNIALSVTVTPPQCVLNEIGKPSCNPRSGSFCARVCGR